MNFSNILQDAKRFCLNECNRSDRLGWMYAKSGCCEMWRPRVEGNFSCQSLCHLPPINRTSPDSRSHSLLRGFSTFSYWQHTYILVEFEQVVHDIIYPLHLFIVLQFLFEHAEGMCKVFSSGALTFSFMIRYICTYLPTMIDYIIVNRILHTEDIDYVNVI